MLRDARARGCERLFCLGDLGGFGAECDAIWPLLRQFGVECIAGNYDIALARGDEDCGCGYSDPRDNELAQLIYDYTREHTSPAFARWMGELPGEHREAIGDVDVHMVHGSPLAVNDFMWESLPEEELAERVEASGADVLLCTHTGLPWQRRVGDTLVVNVGAVGRPANDGRTATWYAVVDLDDGAAAAEIVPVDYDWPAQAASMRAAGLPEAFVQTIETGWWTTCLEVVPPRERSRGRFHVYRDALPDLAAEPSEDLVVPLFGSPVFPPRLWIYTNFDCNLSCSYCAVASSPRARKRRLGLERFARLVDEAVDEGFEELYVTGGEPFVEPAIVDMLEYASDRLPTVVLTNAMLFTGRRRRELERLSGRESLVLQTSIDGARPATHDAARGEGSWSRTIEGIDYGRSIGLPLRAAMTETALNADEVEELRGLLASRGITGDDFAVRPLVRRGFADEGLEVTDAVMVPELTITADGAHWHPVGGDLGSSPDLLVLAGAEVTLAEAKRAVVERFLELPPGRRVAAPDLPVRGMSDALRVGVLTGTGTYQLPGFEADEARHVETRYGHALVTEGRLGDAEVLHVSRHEPGHKRLSNQVQHRANICALKELGADCVIGVTVCGAVDTSVPLGSLVVFDDLHFLTNRLADGSICTFHDEPGERLRGHWIYGDPFASDVRSALLEAAAAAGTPARDGGVYGHVDGPRFNTRAEIRSLALAGVTAVSQTAGPETVLCGEAELPYGLIGYATDYANGVSDVATPVEELLRLIGASSDVFAAVIERAIPALAARPGPPAPTGVIYRFDS